MAGVVICHHSEAQGVEVLSCWCKVGRVPGEAVKHEQAAPRGELGGPDAYVELHVIGAYDGLYGGACFILCSKQGAWLRGVCLFGGNSRKGEGAG